MKKRYVYIVFAVLLLGGFSFHNARADGWEQSYHAGTFDQNGHYMGGTELMYLVPHKGKLYAGTRMLLNPPFFLFAVSAQILVKESVSEPWKLDYQTEKLEVGIDSLASITFGTDDKGNKLSQPVNLLVAGILDFVPGATAVAVRDDEKNTWVKITLPSVNNESTSPAWPTIRSICTHRDTVTGVDHVFAGAYPGGIFSGVYDAAASGQIRWDSTPEFSEFNDRVVSFGECNDELYVAIKPAIYKRVDGTNPAWIKVYEYTTYEGDKPSTQGGTSGMRGLTAIPNPNGEGEVLLMALEGRGSKMVCLDPSDNNSVTTELDFNAFLKEQWADEWETIVNTPWGDYVTPAYNDMTPVNDPKSGEELLVIGLSAYFQPADSNSAWYLVRHPDATYALHEFPYMFDLRGWPKELQGTRTIRVSPFNEDQGRIIYFGGFDVASQYLAGKRSHNTAWIYSADIYTALGISE
jgi:hypothetical protein